MEGEKLTRAKEGMKALLAKLSPTRDVAGLVAFSDSPNVVVPMRPMYHIGYSTESWPPLIPSA
jgi:hypothetical protein